MRHILIIHLCFLAISCSYSQMENNEKTDIEGWYFKAISGYPVSVTFRPVVLFKDGSYFEVDEKPLEDMDFSFSKKNQPELWGTWKKNNTLFILTDHKGNSNDFDLKNGNWFPAFSYDKSISLRGIYEKISGGDFGNGLYALFNSQINFLDGEHFTHSENSGVSSYNANAWKSSKESGTYSIDKNTIQFEYNDGQKLRLSFEIGAKGGNVLDTDMIFIGGKAYVIE